MRSETQISEQLDERLTMNGNKRYLLLLRLKLTFITFLLITSYEMKVYAKNSFDRFGDDLTELILQYLTFEDKVRLECVSKQWQRCVYQRQTVIEIRGSKPSTESLKNLFKRNEYFQPLLDRESLESVLKKCQNITKFSCDFIIDSSVLSLIGQYCPHIKSLTYRLYNDETVLSYFRMYGHKLEELTLFGHSKQIKNILEMCSNVKTISFSYLNSNILNEEKEILPKLEHIKTNILINNTRHRKISKYFVDKYSKTMKTLNVILVFMTTEELKTCFECIARFENLKELKLEFKQLNFKQPIDDCLSLIGQKCNKLLKLDLSIDNSVPISDRFFASFSKFKAIKILKIYLFDRRESIDGSIECFKHCKQLIDLDISYKKLKEDFLQTSRYLYRN